jgi:hypothetical protein
MARRRPTEPTANPARGAALVVVAVVIGLLLLRNGLDTSEAITSNPGSDGQSTDGSDASDEGTDDGSTTTSTVPLRAPVDVPTIVLNDSGIAGAAGQYSEVLTAAAYTLTNPAGANADAEGDAATTLIYFAPGFEAEAAAVGLLIGAPNVVPAALPTIPPGPIANASVVVVLGTDLGGITPTTVAATDSADTTTTTAAT